MSVQGGVCPGGVSASGLCPGGMSALRVSAGEGGVCPVGVSDPVNAGIHPSMDKILDTRL